MSNTVATAAPAAPVDVAAVAGEATTVAGAIVNEAKAIEGDLPAVLKPYIDKGIEYIDDFVNFAQTPMGKAIIVAIGGVAEGESVAAAVLGVVKSFLPFPL